MCFAIVDDSTRPPITSNGLSYGTQPTGSQSAGFQSHVVNPEPVENREEVAHVPVQSDVRIFHSARHNKWYAFPF